MTEQIVTRSCIAGGGPADMMLGLLLGRAGCAAAARMADTRDASNSGFGSEPGHCASAQRHYNSEATAATDLVPVVAPDSRTLGLGIRPEHVRTTEAPMQ